MADYLSPLDIKIETPTVKLEDDCKPLAEIPLATPPIKLETEEASDDGIDVQPRLVAYSSSPPSLIEDQPTSLECIQDAVLPSALSPLRDQFELSTYEYDALEERYRRLQNQHRELKELTSTYNEIIYGSSIHENPDVDLEQLRVDAGREGLRAKALEHDALRLVIQDAGGLEAVTFLTRSAQALVDKAGSLENLQDIVLDTTRIRERVQQIGGLQGLEQLVFNSESLFTEQQALAKLQRSVDGPNGLGVKAAKYDKLKQAFAAIERDPVGNNTLANARGSFLKWTKKRSKTNKTSLAETTQIKVLPSALTRDQAAIVPSSADSTILSAEFGVMNPARAQLLTTAPDHHDPDRDLYEPRATPTLRNLSKKPDNANNLPLGRPRTDRLPEKPHAADIPMKRKHEADTCVDDAKRPRVDIGCASALIQATLAGSGTEPTSILHSYARPNSSRFSVYHNDRRSQPLHSTVEHEHDHKRSVESIQDQVNRLIESRGETVETVDTEPVRAGSSSMDSLLDPVHVDQRQKIKIEPWSDNWRASSSSSAAVINPSKVPKTQVLIGGYPMALWIGVSNPGSFDSPDLIKDDQIPYGLAMFLFTGITKYLNRANLSIWNTMPPNRDTCVLRYLVDEHRPSGLPQERRACRACSSARISVHRPCALLQEIKGTRTVVFMPLRDALRRDVAWSEKRYWVMGA